LSLSKLCEWCIKKFWLLPTATACFLRSGLTMPYKNDRLESSDWMHPQLMHGLHLQCDAAVARTYFEFVDTSLYLLPHRLVQRTGAP
jgi:hypothetical protein